MVDLKATFKFKRLHFQAPSFKLNIINNTFKNDL